MCDQSPHQLQSYYSFSWAFEWELGVPVFVSRARGSAAVPDIFCPGTLWGKFTAICSARGLLILSLIVTSVLQILIVSLCYSIQAHNRPGWLVKMNINSFASTAVSNYPLLAEADVILQRLWYKPSIIPQGPEIIKLTMLVLVMQNRVRGYILEEADLSRQFRRGCSPHPWFC